MTIKTSIKFPKKYNKCDQEWITNILKVAVKSVSSSIGIYHGIEIKSCKIKLKLNEKGKNRYKNAKK